MRFLSLSLFQSFAALCGLLLWGTMEGTSLTASELEAKKLALKVHSYALEGKKLRYHLPQDPSCQKLFLTDLLDLFLATPYPEPDDKKEDIARLLLLEVYPYPYWDKVVSWPLLFYREGALHHVKVDRVMECYSADPNLGAWLYKQFKKLPKKAQKSHITDLVHASKEDPSLLYLLDFLLEKDPALLPLDSPHILSLMHFFAEHPKEWIFLPSVYQVVHPGMLAYFQKKIKVYHAILLLLLSALAVLLLSKQLPFGQERKK